VVRDATAGSGQDGSAGAVFGNHGAHELAKASQPALDSVRDHVRHALCKPLEVLAIDDDTVGSMGLDRAIHGGSNGLWVVLDGLWAADAVPSGLDRQSQL
jgi:hypothetical protein